jgi:5-formyltetrahydrofolate cyclo-ligase
MTHTKSEWRRALLTARSAVPPDVHRRDSAMVATRVAGLSCLAAVRSVLGYQPIGAEVDASRVWALPTLASLPRYAPVFQDGCEPRWASWPEVPDGHGNIAGVSAADLIYPVLALVPGVGFDASGIRLGRGVGFYDRALSALRASGTVYAVGLAFECQIVPSLPFDPWDQPVDCIVTERRVVGRAECGDRREAVP